ncbi:hypothetical protein [Metapseudomonas resinovorans]|uniref:hypothetical protein n=1 Tax=Metapseudomonas resinovorans TaxID=53412 RepID=UPI001E4DCDD2|nr:hypothetical protein [Pseudomonas resinovorans]
MAEVLERAEMIDRNLDAWECTSPNVVRELGGRDALPNLSEMTCIGPVPRLDQETWERASLEYECLRNSPAD